MSGLSISFTSEILAHAQAKGVSLTPAEVESISRNINSVAKVDGTTVTFMAGEQSVPLEQVVAGMSVGYGKPAPAVAPALQGLPSTATSTQRAIATNIANRDGREAAMVVEARRVVDTYGNPWNTGNRTHQAFVSNKDPKLAARLKMQAGGR